MIKRNPGAVTSQSFLHRIPGQPLIYFLSLWVICPFQTFRINENMEYAVLCFWLLSPSLMFSRFIRVIACISMFYLIYWQVLTPAHEYITFCFFIHQLMDIWVLFSLGLLWIMLLWTFACKFLCGCKSSFLLDLYLEVKWNSFILNHCFLNKVSLLLSL